MKKILAIALAFSLAGCSGTLPTINNPLNITSLAQIESTYGVALAGAVAYRNRPRCTKTALESVTNLCARRSIVIRLQQADKAAQIALGQARGFARDNPTLDATSVVAAAQSAVDAFYQIQSGAM